MKRILLLIILSFIGINSHAQNEKTIGVNSYVFFKPKIKEYTTNIILQLDAGGYGNPVRYSSLNELKESFLKKMNEKGVEKNKFTETPLKVIESYGGVKNNMISLTFVTNDPNDITKLTTTGIYIRIYNSYAKVDFKDSDFEKLTDLCLKKAKKSATIIAKQTNYKLGKIKSIGTDSFNTFNNSKISISEINEKQKFGIYVTYVVE